MSSKKKKGVSSPSTKELPALDADIKKHLGQHKEIRAFELELRRQQRRPGFLKKDIQTLREAAKVFRRFESLLSVALEVDEGKKLFKLGIDPYRVAPLLEWAVSRLSAYCPTGGPIPDFHLGMYADELSDWYRQKTGLPHWEKVGRILVSEFPETLPPDDDRGRDLRLWVKKLVKRHQKLINDKEKLARAMKGFMLNQFNDRWRKLS